MGTLFSGRLRSLPYLEHANYLHSPTQALAMDFKCLTGLPCLLLLPDPPSHSTSVSPSIPVNI